MNFVTNPIMKSFVGFDNLFDEFERLSTYKEQSYPAYNIEVTNAELVNGMLIISLHRNIPEAQLPKQIEIKTPSRKILSKKAA